MQTEQLQLLRCPQGHTPLVEAPRELIEDLNRAIRDGQLTTVSGKRVDQPIDGGLMRIAGDLLYPVVDGIPVLLHDEAIALEHGSPRNVPH